MDGKKSLLLPFGFGTDHPAQKFHSSPLGGKNTDKQSSSAQLACLCLILSHLTTINGTKGGIIYFVQTALLKLKLFKMHPNQANLK